MNTYIFKKAGPIIFYFLTRVRSLIYYGIIYDIFYVAGTEKIARQRTYARN